MRKMVQGLLRQYGTDIILGERTVRGLLQPVTGKLERLALQDPGPLGIQSRQRYLYIGPVEPKPEEDTVLYAAGKGYTVRSVHLIQGPGGPIYSWAVCVERGEERHE